MAFGQDATFNEDAFVTRVNADLANNLGNLVSRTLAMQQRYFDGVVQEAGELTDEDRQLADAFTTAARELSEQTEQLAFHRALESLWRAVDAANKYIVTTAPFKLAKDDATKPRAGAVLRHLLESLHVTAVLLHPFLPETSARILGLLGAPEDAPLREPLQWGTAVSAGHTVGKPEILFPRIETEAS
jgi:methionyl-tRNA synthetase